MSFFKMPFQFSSTDVAGRQSELMRRFGIPSGDKTMLIETPHASCYSAGSGSPRLQHRIPGFLENHDQMGVIDQNMMNDADSVDSIKKSPRVRVVPISLENDEMTVHKQVNGRHTLNKKCDSPCSRGKNVPNQELQNSPPSLTTRICNIPIKFESPAKAPVNQTTFHQKSPIKKKNNGPCVSKKQSTLISAQLSEKELQRKSEPLRKQIENILVEFHLLKDDVEKFSGHVGDKKYKYLDEMLMRCMLKLDDVETVGNEEVRKLRKAAVKEVQDCVNILESRSQTNKAVESVEVSSNKLSDSVDLSNSVVGGESEEMTICTEHSKFARVADDLRISSTDIVNEPTEVVLKTDHSITNSEEEKSVAPNKMECDSSIVEHDLASDMIQEDITSFVLPNDEVQSSFSVTVNGSGESNVPFVAKEQDLFSHVLLKKEFDNVCVKPEIDSAVGKMDTASFEVDPTT